MGRNEGAAAVDGLAAIGLEGVGDIIELDAKDQSQKVVAQSVQNQLETWIVDGAAALDESAAEDTVVSVVQLCPIANDIAAVVGLVRHHDHCGVPLHVVEALDDGPAESVAALVLDWDQFGHMLLERGENVPGLIGTAIVDHYDLVRNSVELQLQVQMLHGGRNTALLVPGGNDYGQHRKRWTISWWRSHESPDQSSHCGFFSA